MKMRYILISFVLMCGIASCKKDDFNYPKGYVGSSRITYFADLTLGGSQYMSLVVGDAFVDSGATATQSGNDLPVTETGSVDVNQVGIYTLTYSATNSDGFPASVTRTVAVLPSAELPGVDISGSYYYVTTGGNNSTITKLAPGFYATTNCWSDATTIPCFFICLDGENITMPDQSTAFGDLYGTGTLSPSGALDYVVSIESQGIFGTVRHWHRK